MRRETHWSGAPGKAVVVATFVSDEDHCSVGTKLMSGRCKVLRRTVRALPIAALP